MEIVINGKIAVLKRNTSFDFVSENFLFTGSDSYTLTITFPLKDCPQNVAIFGLVSRKDVDKDNIIYDCLIRDKGFAKAGAITITEINDVEVKTQFLEGRSVQNFDTSFDDIYLNNLRLGYPAERRQSMVTPANAWMQYPLCYAVALPWVNNTSGNIQNEAKFENGVWSWVGDKTLSFQPYLLYLLDRICNAVGYTYDFDEIESSEMRYLLVCNCLPAVWSANDYAYALPHWSLTEFFEELENFLYGEFSIDHATKHIDFHFSKTVITNRAPVYIEKVVNAYTVNVSRDKNCDYIGVKNIKYAENDNRFWPYRDCAWFIRENKDDAVVYDTLAELLTFAATLKESGVYPGEGSRSGDLYTRGYKQGSDGHKLYYAKDVDQYFIMFCYDAELVKTTTVRDQEYHWYKYYNRLEPINQFGGIEYDKDADEVELKIVPAWIDDTDEEHGQCLFLECGEMGSLAELEEEDDGNGSSTNHVTPGGGTFGGSRLNPIEGRTNSGNSDTRSSTTAVDETDYDGGALAQAKTGKTIERGEQESSDEYFDRIYIGYWDGTNRNAGLLPFPFVHSLVTKNDFTRQDYPYTLSLQRSTPYYDRGATIPIDGKKKYNFSFIADTIPDVRAVFNIWGKRYLCEKITAQFTEKGMSQMLKGVFYRIDEGQMPVEVINFEDENVKAICVANWGGNVIEGEMTPGEAAAVTSLDDAFYGNTDIVKFNELRYFTGLTSLYSKQVSNYPAGQFYNCTKLQEVTIPQANITNFNGAFRGCSVLKSLDMTPTKATSIECAGVVQLSSNNNSMTYLKIPGCEYTGTFHYFANRRNGLTTIEVEGTADLSAVTQFYSAFSILSALENIRSTVDGAPPIIGISNNISFTSCPNLTLDSLRVIINGLADLTGKAGKTLTLHETAKARLEASDLTAISDKNWSLA